MYFATPLSPTKTESAFATTPVLEVKNLTKSYGQAGLSNEKIDVLKGINMTVNKAEVVAIIGRSGSGKTTLLSLLEGLDTATSGQVICAHTDMGTLSEDALALFRARHLGIVFQRFHLMPHLTALENVRLVLDIADNIAWSERHHMALSAIESVGMAHRAHHFPAQLSGGECQRVAIARAMIHHPTLILADEPTGNLDEDHAQLVADKLFSLVEEKGLSMIVVTHNLELGRRCHRMLTLHGGVFVDGA